VTLVCGIDVGSFRTPSFVAWLEDGSFELDAYAPSLEQPLPPGRTPAAYALDAPQGLPAPGRSRRVADRKANTPTRILPRTREEVADMTAFAPFVEAGLGMFWEAQRGGLAAVPGCRGSGPALLETYPRLVIRRLWPELARIPSKRKEPRRYVEELWLRLQQLGLEGPAPGRHDHVDALLCAVAGRSWLDGRAVEVGEAPEPDQRGRVFREGFIVAPRSPAPPAADALTRVPVSPDALRDG
jgi:predicted nuclease with RNAse H fold